jgi:hypothetical protein
MCQLAAIRALRVLGRKSCNRSSGALSEGGEPSPATTEGAPADALGRNALPADVPERAELQSGSSRAVPGVAPAAAPQLPAAAPATTGGSGVAGSAAVVEPGVLPAGTSKPTGVPNSPTLKPGLAEP